MKKRKFDEVNEEYPLTVYKASAGSGKTFTLAVEYIKLLIKNPYCYRNILAVTFTNKATEEMKMRILSQLYGIWKQLPDSDSYIQKICSELEISREQASLQAGIALTLLLHHYNDFRIETIDSFFQSVLRNLARELDLTPNLRIELNDKQIEEEAVDNMIEKLDTTNEVLGWIMKFIKSNIEDDKTWNVIGQIKSFGLNIFKEYYKRESGRLKEFLNSPGQADKYEKVMHALAEEARKQIAGYADHFFEILDNNGLTVNDLSRNTSGPAGAFVKISRNDLQSDLFGASFMSALDKPEKWFTAANAKKHPEWVQTATEQLQPLQASLLQNYPILYKRYASARLTTKLMTQLRLLDRIERSIRELNEGANRFLLSDTQQLLQSLIGDSDSPFVFEKIGTRLSHIMIDEFQDTSTIQWQNFRTLLLECMSQEESSNLIVGDVKQSIYRWRSGDWRLLNNIEQEFPHHEDAVEIKPLETNYRSEHNVIAFNNAFFTTATDIMTGQMRNEHPAFAAQLRQAYADVVQQIPPHKTERRGLVSIKLLDKDEEDGYANAVLEEIASTIDMLIEKGVKQSDIALLVRQNKYIPSIASYFLDRHKNVNIVSDEAFQLKSSVAVGVIINAMRVVADRSDNISMAALTSLYVKHVKGDTTISDGELQLSTTDKAQLLPQGFTENIDTLATLPLHELAEKVFDLFSLETLTNQSAYLSTFYDHLSKFANDKANDINKFLQEWDSRLSTKTIKSNDVEGVRILSIHASKGLEYDNVIIPYCDWQLEIGGDTLWCTPQEEPYNELPLVPVNNYSGQMRGTIYEDDYEQEHFQNTVDNLNLLYVAFTRASANLFVIGKRGQSDNYRSKLIETCMEQIISQSEAQTGNEHVNKITPEQGSTATDFTFGELYIKQKTSAKTTDNVLLQHSLPLTVEMASHETKANFRQSNASIKFIENGGEDEEEVMSFLKTGSILHEIFSTIRTTDDIDGVLAQMQNDGVLYDDDVTNERLTALMRKRLSDPKIAEWFAPKWTLLNECTILKWDDREQKLIDRRPDRVMTDGKQTIVVDFKFGKPKEEHHTQVKEYMTLLKEMGYDNVKGYLWYVYANEVLSV